MRFTTEQLDRIYTKFSEDFKVEEIHSPENFSAQICLWTCLHGLSPEYTWSDFAKYIAKGDKGTFNQLMDCKDYYFEDSYDAAEILRDIYPEFQNGEDTYDAIYIWLSKTFNIVDR